MRSSQGPLVGTNASSLQTTKSPLGLKQLSQQKKAELIKEHRRSAGLACEPPLPSHTARTLGTLGVWQTSVPSACLCAQFSHWLFPTPRIVAHQALLSMGFSRQEYWSGLPALLQGLFPTQGSNPGLLPCRWILYCWGSPAFPIVLCKNQLTTVSEVARFKHKTACL